MLKQAARVEDLVKAEPGEMNPDRRISFESDNHDDFDLENRWTPVAFTLALDEAEGEV
jgi:hypothetical protein